MTGSGNRSRRRMGAVASIVGYVIGLIGMGALIAAVMLLAQLDARQRTQERRLETLQTQLTQLGTDSQWAARPIVGSADQSVETATSAAAAPLAASLTTSISELQRRLEVLEAEASRPQLTPLDAAQLQQQLADWESRLEALAASAAKSPAPASARGTGETFAQLAQEYESLKQDFQQQARQLHENQQQLVAVREQIRQLNSRQTVLRSEPGAAGIERQEDQPDVRVLSRRKIEITDLPPAADSTRRASGGVE